MLTRMVGAVLIIAAAVEFIMHYRIFELMKNGKWKEFWQLVLSKGLWILFMLTGGIAYLFLNWWVSGNIFMFMYYQRTHWNNSTQYFWRTINTQFSGMLHGLAHVNVRGIFLPNLISFAFSILMLGYACIKRHNLVYIVFALGYIFISFAPSWLLSGARYTLVCVPLFIFLAELLGKNPLKWLLALTLFIAGLIPFFYLFLRGGPVL